MDTSKAIELFGSFWEAWIVEPDNDRDRCDITKYRVVIEQRLCAHHPPGNYDQALERALDKLADKNHQIGCFLGEEEGEPFKLLGFYGSSSLGSLFLEKRQEALKPFRRKLIKNYRNYKRPGAIRSSIGSAISLDVRPLGEEVIIHGLIEGQDVEKVTLFLTELPTGDGIDVSIFEMGVHGPYLDHQNSSVNSVYFTRYSIHPKVIGLGPSFIKYGGELESLISGPRKSVDAEEDRHRLFATKEDAIEFANAFRQSRMWMHEAQRISAS